MHYLFNAVFAWTLVYALVGKRFLKLWRASFIGVALVIVVDYLGTKFNLYLYPLNIISIGGLPLFHIIASYPLTMLYLNWLPRHWDRRILYTAYFSVLLLALEALMFSAGAIIYPNWKLWYSYFLTVAGLSLVAFLADRLTMLLKHHQGTKI
jgi:hypothetical protein